MLGPQRSPQQLRVHPRLHRRRQATRSENTLLTFSVQLGARRLEPLENLLGQEGKSYGTGQATLHPNVRLQPTSTSSLPQAIHSIEFRPHCLRDFIHLDLHPKTWVKLVLNKYTADWNQIHSVFEPSPLLRGPTSLVKERDVPDWLSRTWSARPAHV